MRRKRCTIGLGMAGALTGVLVASIAWADGDCYKGYRDTTPAERATMTAILETVKKAVPPAPEGWVILGDDQVSVMTSLCKDYEAIPWDYSYTRYYQDVAGQGARDSLIAAAAAGAMADLAQKQPRLDAITARMQALTQEVIAAMEKGDQERINAKNLEIQKASEEYKQVLEEGGATERMTAATEEASRDQTMTLTVTINSGSESPYVEAQAFEVPGMTQPAYRWNSGKEDNALVLLGQWKAKDEGGMDLVPRANTPVEAAHGISIRVSADPGRIVQTVEAIDFKALKGLISK